MKEKLENFIVQALCLLFMVLVGAHALFVATSCAHVGSPSVSACRPVAADVDTVLADLQADGWQAALEQLAAAKGLCLVNAAVDQVITALSQATSTRAVLAGADDTLSRARAWRQLHP